MARFMHLNRPSITTHTGENISIDDDSVLCTDNVYTHENVLRIMSNNNICPDVHQADWIIQQLPLYYTEHDVLRIDALI